VRWFNGIKQIFQADGAVGVEPFGLAQMIKRSNARATHVTVHKIIITLHTTNAAFITMVIISLNTIIKKVAHSAKIGGELNATLIVATRLRHGLSVITLIAHHFLDGVPIHCVRLGVVVAVAAPICLVATRGH
jgi:hypothetical protein